MAPMPVSTPQSLPVNIIRIPATRRVSRNFCASLGFIFSPPNNDSFVIKFRIKTFHRKMLHSLLKYGYGFIIPQWPKNVTSF